MMKKYWLIDEKYWLFLLKYYLKLVLAKYCIEPIQTNPSNQY